MRTGRTNGEGTVYRRKDGRWEGAAYLLTPSGRRRRISVYGPTRTEAHAKLTRHLADSQRGMPIPERSWTVAAYLDYWVSEVAPIRRQPRTIELYESTIRVHLKPRLGGQSLSQLSVVTLQKLLNQQLADGHSTRVVQITRTVLSAALTNAVREELVSRNVARLVLLPTGERKPISPWTDIEARRFLETASSERL